MKLEGRRILITGATSGIGAETARLFAREGARLALTCLDATRVAATRAQLAQPEQHVDLVCDVTDPARVAECVAEAEVALGGLDGLVHSAGRDHVAPFEATTLDAWKLMLDTNLTSAFLLCQAIVPALRSAGGGTIVTLASGAALRPIEGRTAYSSAKAGLVMLSKALALELAADDIRVNALCPGAIDTPMLRESAGGEVGDSVPEAVRSRFAMGRVGEVDEMARAVLFLSCRDSSFVTGTALAADGGRTFH